MLDVELVAVIVMVTTVVLVMAWRFGSSRGVSKSKDPITFSDGDWGV